VKLKVWVTSSLGAIFLMTLVGSAAAQGEWPSGAQPAVVAAPATTLERWAGTIYRHDQVYSPPDPTCAATLHRFLHLSYQLQVDQTGALQGTVIGAADDFPISTNCNGSIFILDPVGSFQVTGHRFTAAGGVPAFQLDNITPLHLGRYLVMSCGPAKIGGLVTQYCLKGVYPLTINDFLILSDQYLISPASNGQHATACLAVPDLDELGYFISRSHCLVGEGPEPALTLSSELIQPGTFLNQVSVSDQFQATVNWNALDGGHLIWQLGQLTPESVPPTGNTLATTFIKTLDVGNLPTGLGQTSLKAQAYGALGQISPPQSWPIAVAPPPAWAGPTTSITPTKQAGAVSYEWDQSVPQPPFNLSAVIPAAVPLIGGSPFAFLQVKVPTHFQVWSPGYGVSQGTADGGLELMNGLAHGKGTTASLLNLNAAGVSIVNGQLSITANDNLDVKEPLRTLVPPFGAFLNTLYSVWPTGTTAIDQITTLHLPVGVDLTANFPYAASGSQVVLQPASVTTKLPLNIRPASLTLGPLSFSAGVAGDIHMTIQAPQLDFTNLGATFVAWAKATLFHFGACASVGWSWTFPNLPTDNSMPCGPGMAAPWQLLDRGYLSAPDYGRWVAPRSPVLAPSGESADTALVASVYPQAQPYLAVSPTHRLLVWSHDQSGSLALSGQEIAYSTACNSCAATWTPWLSATHDSLADFAPQAAFVNDNTALAVWERFDTATPPDINSDPAGYLSHVQIAAAQWNAISSTWSAPQFLSAGGLFSSRPQVGPTSTGALAAWVGNASDYLIGDAGHPDQILSSRYVSATQTWSAPSPVITNVAALLSYSLATNGTHAALVYAVDTGGVLSSTNTDAELFYTTWTGSAWSAPARLTNNAVPDEDPQLALDGAGNPLLVWLRNGVVKFLAGGWNATPVDLPITGPAPTGDLRLARSAAGDLALTWRVTTSTDTRLAYTIYDGSTGTWGPVQTIQPPAVTGALPGATPSVVNFSPAFGRDDGSDPTVNDTLLIGYQLAAVDSVTATVGGVTVTGIPNVSVNSVHLVDVPLGINLSVTAADLSASSSAGQTHLAAVVHNTGDLSVSGAPAVLQVLVDNGLGLLSETQRLTQTLGTLAAGQSVTVTFPVTPSALGDHVYAVEIDPAQTLNETRLDDNVAVLGSALALQGLPSSYGPDGVLLRASVSQSATLYNSLNVTASLNLDSPAGPQLDSVMAVFPITPTASLTVSSWITAGQLGPGWHMAYWNLDPANQMGQADRSHSVVAVAVGVLPDLTTDPERIGFGTSPGASAPFNAEILNNGNWLSHGGRVAIFDADPTYPGAHALLSLPLPDIAAGASVELSGTLNLSGLPAATTGLSSIYVQIDPDHALAELDKNNNLVPAGKIPGRSGGAFIYLPLVGR